MLESYNRYSKAELKNLRPQLYSAADYCENSYLQNEQKQVVVSNLKDYTRRALVNAVDHLGTVAYKLSDLLEQHTLDILSMGLKDTCLNQQLLTCQSYTDKEVIRQQQLLAIIPRHHKHYILPNAVNKKVHFSPHVQMDPRQQVKARLYPSAASAAITLSWQLASETKSSLRGSLFWYQKFTLLSTRIWDPGGENSGVKISKWLIIQITTLRTRLFLRGMHCKGWTFPETFPEAVLHSRQVRNVQEINFSFQELFQIVELSSSPPFINVFQSNGQLESGTTVLSWSGIFIVQYTSAGHLTIRNAATFMNLMPL